MRVVVKGVQLALVVADRNGGTASVDVVYIRFVVLQAISWLSSIAVVSLQIDITLSLLNFFLVLLLAYQTVTLFSSGLFQAFFKHVAGFDQV